MSISAHLLVHLPYLSALKRQGSFTAAADELHITQAAMSYQIKQLENKLGCTLVVRRSGGPLIFSAEGDALVKEFQYCANRLDRTIELLTTREGAGPLRISAPVDLGSLLMPKVIAAMRKARSNLDVTLHISDSLVDLQASKHDFAIRAFSDEHTDKTEVLYRSALTLVASPVYLQSKPKPRDLNDLKQHTLLLRDAKQSNSWSSLLSEKELLVRGPVLSLGTTVALREAAVEGLGIALLPRFVVDRELQGGCLIELLASKTKGSEVCYRLARLPLQQLDSAALAIKAAFDGLSN